MLDMERNPLRKGGILADSMGLGKTIQMVSQANQRCRLKDELAIADS